MSKQKLFIGISGKMGVGKTTISQMLQSIMPNSEVLAFASPLYKAQDMIYDQYSLNLQGDKDRDLLIAIGQWGRNIDPDFWIEQFAKQALESEFEIIICDDIRFPNEAKFFEKFGTLVRIDGEQRGDNVDSSRATNITETALDNYKFDHVISNKQSPADICMAIANVMLGK